MVCDRTLCVEGIRLVIGGWWKFLCLIFSLFAIPSQRWVVRYLHKTNIPMQWNQGTAKNNKLHPISPLLALLYPSSTVTTMQTYNMAYEERSSLHYKQIHGSVPLVSVAVWKWKMIDARSRDWDHNHAITNTRKICWYALSLVRWLAYCGGKIKCDSTTYSLKQYGLLYQPIVLQG